MAGRVLLLLGTASNALVLLSPPGSHNAFRARRPAHFARDIRCNCFTNWLDDRSEKFWERCWESSDKTKSATALQGGATALQGGATTFRLMAALACPALFEAGGAWVPHKWLALLKIMVPVMLLLQPMLPTVSRNLRFIVDRFRRALTLAPSLQRRPGARAPPPPPPAVTLAPLLTLQGLGGRAFPKQRNHR